MSNLFDNLPHNFFSILASGNKEIYVDAVMLLHRMFELELNIRVDDYTSALISLLEDRVYVLEADDEMPTGSLTLNIKARLILDRLIKTGWLDKELLDGSFIEIITPRGYAIKMMKLLAELSNPSAQEYNSLVFATYSGLNQAKNEHRAHMYEALLSAKSNTEQLIYELKSLYHGIRRYLRFIAVQSNINDLLENHFEEYKQLADRIYHPIKTMDSVHRYMGPIQEILMDILADQSLVAEMRERAMAIKKYQQEADAGQEILSAIDYITGVYQSIGDIVTEIDRKHSAYTKNSIEKIQYLISADQTIKGKLVEILRVYAVSEAEGRNKVGEMLEQHIRINRQEFLDGSSLYHKNVRSRRHQTRPLALSNDAKLDQQGLAQLKRQLTMGYSIHDINTFVKELYPPGQGSVTSEKIEVYNDDDFVLLILAVVRANERGARYRVKIHDGRFRYYGYQIPNMTISQKGGTPHVE